MTVGGGQVTRWIVVLALGVATAAMFVISMRGNYLYGYSIGQTEEKRTLFAWANVAADVWKAFGLLAVAMLWHHRHWRVALVGCIAWLLCLFSGLNSAIGVYVQDRSELTGTREAKHATYTDAEKALAGLEATLRGLPKHRSAGEVDALITVVLARPVSIGDRVRGTVATLSSDCKKPDARTVEACGEVAQLRSERAVAEEAVVLRKRADLLRKQVNVLRDAGSSVAPDPVGEFYAWLTGGLLSVRDVGFGFPLFFALLIEVVSAFGPITIVRYVESTRTELASASAVRPAMASLGRRWPGSGDHVEEEEGRVVAWMAERASPSADATSVGIDELLHDYNAWCAGKTWPTSSLKNFGDEFDRVREMPELAGKTRKFGNRYYGIALVAHASLAAPRRQRG